MPTSNQVGAAQELYGHALAWQASYDTIRSLCKQYPQHDDVPLVQVKVCLINQLYRAGLQAEQKMAEHLVGLKGLHQCLHSGGADAVKMVATTSFSGESIFWVFATKYCHFHNPEHFPIYDRFAGRALGMPNPSPPVVQWYEEFRQAVQNAIMKTGQSFSFAEMDRFLWLKGQKMETEKDPAKTQTLSLEVRSLLTSYPELWEQL